ncbi:MAG: hypothetical protein ACE5IR_18660 [bacterium]
MAKNYLIGIGGTGARVIEAMAFMCAAGYGPEELNVFLVDPDAGNGNLTRTKTLLSLYKECQERFAATKPGEPFRTKIKSPEKFVWEIFEDKDTTLSNYINYQNLKQTRRDLAGLAEVLFTESELMTKLNEGFRGHPAIGAVVMSSPPEDKNPWKTLWEDIERATRVNELRVFLVGSIFGGTGAAGIPTFGAPDMIKFNPNARVGEQSKVLLGGALVMPYFTFDSDDGTTESLFISSADFPIATRAALHYYNTKDLAFDQLYFIGDSLAQRVGRFSPGSLKQENAPHYIEMTTGLAACDFFDQPDNIESTEKLYFTACRDSRELKWESLPVTRDTHLKSEKQNKLKSQMTTMAVFAYALNTYGKTILAQKYGEILDTWYLDHFWPGGSEDDERKNNPGFVENEELINKVSSFANRFLTWICAFDDETRKVMLVDREKIVNGDIESGKEPELFDPLTNRSNIARMLKEPSQDRDFAYFVNRDLNQIKISDRTLTAGNKFLKLFYEAAKKYSLENFTIK